MIENSWHFVNLLSFAKRSHISDFWLSLNQDSNLSRMSQLILYIKKKSGLSALWKCQMLWKFNNSAMCMLPWYLQVKNFHKISFVYHFIKVFEQKFYMTVLLCRIICQKFWYKYEQKELSQGYYPVLGLLKYYKRINIMFLM